MTSRVRNIILGKPLMLRKLTFLIPVFLAFLSLTCAPTENPKGSTDNKKDDEPIKLVVMPKGLPERINYAIEQTQKRDLTTQNGFWTVFHGILGNGLDTTLLIPATKERVNAIDYIREERPLQGLEFVPTPDGLDVVTRPGAFIAQGHQDQFVAEMVQWGMPPDKKFTVHGKDYTFEDFFKHSKARASVKADPPQELSWAILIIAEHYGTEGAWKNNIGEELSFEDIVRYEVNEPILSAACGGTHRLFGLTWAYHLHRAKGGAKTGVWKEVADKIDKYKKIAKEYQNDDFSFSTEYFKPWKGDVDDLQLKIGTTGHILEWLSLAMTDEELSAGWVEDAANKLTQMG